MSERTAVAIQGVADLLEQILARLPTAAERFDEEERRAWDMCHARWLTAESDDVARRYADEALSARRKRFPPPAAASQDEVMATVPKALLDALIDTVQMGLSGPASQKQARELAEQLAEKM